MSSTAEYQRQWRVKNAEHSRRRGRERYQFTRVADIARRMRNYRAVHPLTPRTCLACQVTFTPPQRNQQRYCSVDCHDRIRHRVRPAIPKHTRRIILNRDGWQCYLCDEPIPHDVAWPHPMSGTVDHVIPWIAGGTGRRENLRAAHWSCNRRKAASLLEVA